MSSTGNRDYHISEEGAKMYTRNRFWAIVGGSLLLGSVTSGEAAAQSRRASMQPAPSMMPVLPMTPYNPNMGLQNLYSNPWLQYGLNRYGYSMPYAYGN